MGADAQDLISKLMIQQAMNQNQQPSFMGLQAPQDPGVTAGILARLKQQQVLDQANAPTGGQYGYLHDAGKAAFNSIGSTVGGTLAALGNQQTAPQQQGPAFTMPPPAMDDSGNPAQNLATAAPIPNPGATPQQSMNNMVLAAKAYYAAQVNNGIDPDQAKVTTAQALVKWGALTLPRFHIHQTHAAFRLRSKSAGDR